MELKRDQKYCIALIFILSIFFIFPPAGSYARESLGIKYTDNKPYSGNVFPVRTDRDISLVELIAKSGYTIADEDVVPFLTEFMKLNPDIKSISALKKGMSVKIPLDNLKKTGSSLLKLRDKTKLNYLKRKTARQKDKTPGENRTVVLNSAMLLRNIKTLLVSLDDNILLETEGFKFFNVSENSQISFDTSFFPVIYVNKERTIILDYSGILPEEIKDIIEVTWPEYRVVKNTVQNDLKKIIGILLESIGYSVRKDKVITAGGISRIEYLADLLVFRKNLDLLDNTILIIGIIGADEFATPENIVEWLRARDINLIELSYAEAKRFYQNNSKVIHIGNHMDAEGLTENILTLLGYKFSRDMVMNLSDRPEYGYNLKADLSINLGYRTKVIEFAEFSDYEIRFARKRGIDVICIKPSDQKRDIINKIMSLLSINYKDSPRANSSYITPKGVKYRLLSPGIFVNSINGPLFFTDSEFNPEMLRQLVDEKTVMVTF
ncbi:MAG: hypothetical protein AB1632_11470 [Nitrospirota bacterium]